MKAYTLKKHAETEELHLFEGDMTPNDPKYPCTSKSQSICEKMKNSQSDKNIFFCATEQEARDKCAKLGRAVCGICVSHLYADPK